MGRTLTSQGSVNTDSPNDLFMGEKPVWMYYGVNTSAAATYLTFFGNNMDALHQGSAQNSYTLSSDKNSIAATLQAMSQTEGGQYFPYGHTSTQGSTNALSPNGGAHGPCLFGQTVSNVGLMFNSRGQVKPSHYSSWQGYGERVYGGVIVGENGYQQGISINCHNQYLTIHRAGSYPNSGGLTSTAYGGFNYTDTSIMVHSGDTSNYGAAGYNRNTGTFALLQYIGTDNSFRLHKWKGLPKLSLDNATFKQALVDAKTTGRYESHDITLASVSDNEWRYRATVIPTNDGGVWVAKKGGSSALYVYAVASDGSVTDFGTCTSPTTHYTYSNTPRQAHSFQVAENQSCVAIFHQYYYYACGLHAVYLSTKSIGKMTYSQHNDTTSSTSFSRIGGSKFAFHLSSNADVGTNRCLPIYIIDPDVERSEVGIKRQVSHSVVYPDADHYTGSTCYSGPFIMPVYPHWLDSTEYKEMSA